MRDFLEKYIDVPLNEKEYFTFQKSFQAAYNRAHPNQLDMDVELLCKTEINDIFMKEQLPYFLSYTTLCNVGIYMLVYADTEPPVMTRRTKLSLGNRFMTTESSDNIIVDIMHELSSIRENNVIVSCDLEIEYFKTQAADTPRMFASEVAQDGSIISMDNLAIKAAAERKKIIDGSSIERQRTPAEEMLFTILSNAEEKGRGKYMSEDDFRTFHIMMIRLIQTLFRSCHEQVGDIDGLNKFLDHHNLGYQVATIGGINNPKRYLIMPPPIIHNEGK